MAICPGSAHIHLTKDSKSGHWYRRVRREGIETEKQQGAKEKKKGQTCMCLMFQEETAKEQFIEETIEEQKNH